LSIPLLDVSFVLDCPEFNDDTLLVYASTDDVRWGGVARSTGNWLPISGVVVPASGRDLDRTGEGDRLDGTITVYTRAPLSTGYLGRSADRLMWGNGGPGVYEVISATLYSFGSQFTRVTCKLAEPNPDPAGTQHGPGFFS
jgi:hypothetical protein